MQFHLVSIEPKNFLHAKAWYELAELVLHGLVRAGFDCTSDINRFSPKRTNIVFGTHYVTAEMKALLPPDTIFFNTEQLTNLSEDFCHQRYMQIRYWAQQKFRFLDYSAENIDVLKAWGASEATHMPLGYVPELERIELVDPEYDCLFYGGINKRRLNILKSIEDTGTNLQILNGVYGDERDDFIAKSKVVLNLHLYDSEILEVVRINYLLHNKICVLTKVNSSTKIDKELEALLVCCPRESIATQLAVLIKETDEVNSIANRGYEWLRSRPQELIIKDIW